MIVHRVRRVGLIINTLYYFFIYILLLLRPIYLFYDNNNIKG